MDRIEILIAAIAARPKDQGLLLLLDYDGTLVDIVSRPELALPTQELLNILVRLSYCPDPDLMVVSGRPLMDLLELLPIKGLDYVGSHGGEGLIRGKPWTLKAGANTIEEREALQRELVGKLENLSGWWLETKPLGFALHYRHAEPQEEVRIMSVLDSWLSDMDRTDLHQILRGKKVVEILPQGVSKGAAIREILRLPGFFDLFPVYLGDDVTDESAFQVLQGRGLTIKVGFDTGTTAATYSLANPAAVQKFLTLLAAHLEDRV